VRLWLLDLQALADDPDADPRLDLEELDDDCELDSWELLVSDFEVDRVELGLY
jgi:hypothetical protein